MGQLAAASGAPAPPAAVAVAAMAAVVAANACVHAGVAARVFVAAALAVHGRSPHLRMAAKCAARFLVAAASAVGVYYFLENASHSARSHALSRALCISGSKI